MLWVAPRWPERFVDTWQAWRSAKARPKQLHVVSLTDEPPDLSTLEGLLDVRHKELTQELTRQCWGLLEGVHRLVFEGGALSLTLCIGSPVEHLREQDLGFESIDLSAGAPTPTEAAAWASALARCSRRGTSLKVARATREFAATLQKAGFALMQDSHTVESEGLQATFNPPWQTGTRRPQRKAMHEQPGRCTIIGAGLAGAACAASLGRRGWQVTVMDWQGPAAGASGLPVGLMAPHVSPDDSPLSRLSRSGVRATLEAAHRLLVEGRDWAPTGVLQRRLDRNAGGLPRHWPEAGHAWSCPASADALPPSLRQDSVLGSALLADAVWHASGAWIKPARLIAAWLGQSGIATACGVEVAQLRQTLGNRWQALDVQGQVLAESELVILANAHRVQSLLEPWLPAGSATLQPVRGQVSWALQAQGEHLPGVPVNGNGSLVSYSTEAGRAWLLGATFERDSSDSELRPQDHTLNLEKLQKLLPETAITLAPRFRSDRVQAWAGVRCSTRDHLPLVGQISADLAGLWLCTGFGSRGLSYCALCAELIAAWLHAEPLPLPARLAHQLKASRLIKPS